MTDTNDVAVAAVNAGGGVVSTLGSKWMDLAEWRKIVVTITGLFAIAGLVVIFTGYERRAEIIDAAFRPIRAPVLNHAMAQAEVERFHNSVDVVGAEASLVFFVNRTTHRRGLIAWAADARSRTSVAQIARDEADVSLSAPGAMTSVDLRLDAQRPYWTDVAGDTRFIRYVVPAPPRLMPAGDVVGFLVVIVERGASQDNRAAIERAAETWALRLTGQR